MTPILERALALFVSPPVPSDAPDGWAPPVPPTSTAAAGSDPPAAPSAPPGALTVVLGTSGGAVLLGAAVANELRARARAASALLVVWDPSGASAASGPAWPASRRLAERLATGESPAVARGRLTRVALPHHAEAAALRVSELLSGDFHAVLVVAGPRPVAFDPVLAEAQRVLVEADAERPPSLAGLAADELTRLGPEVALVPPLTSAVGRLLAGAGLGRLRRLPATDEAAGG